MASHLEMVKLGDYHPLHRIPVPDKDIMFSISLVCPHSETWSLKGRVKGRDGIRRQISRPGTQELGPLHGFHSPKASLQHGPYLKQWAAVRIQWWSRMLPPQMCCLLYWMLTCQGQASTGAFSPPTTRGAFRLSPQAGLGSKERKSRSQAFGGWSYFSLELKSISSRLLCLRPGVVVVKRTRPILSVSWGDIEFQRPQTFPGLPFLFILFFQFGICLGVCIVNMVCPLCWEFMTLKSNDEAESEL